MKRIALFALAGVLAWAALAWAQSPNFSIEKPQGWSGQQASQVGGLEAQFIAPGQDAFIEVYAQPSGPVDLEWYADEWVRLVVANGVPHHNLITNAMSSTNTGVPGLVREYTGQDQGNAFRSLLIFSYYDGFMYIVQGMYVDGADSTNASAIYNSLDSFAFPGSQYQPPGDTTQDPGFKSNGCNGIMGTWAWFNGGTAVFEAGGVVQGSTDSWWECTGVNQFRIHWTNDTWIDDLTLTDNNQRLSGHNQYNNPVSATRVNTGTVQPPAQPPAQPPVQPSVQPPAQQGQTGAPQMGSPTGGQPDRAWADDGRCGAQWGLVQGGNSGDCFFYVSTSKGINLHLRNTTGNAQDLFRVEIADKVNNMALVAREEHIGPAVRKIPLPPGVYRVLVVSQSPGMVPWKAYWD